MAWGAVWCGLVWCTSVQSSERVEARRVLLWGGVVQCGAVRRVVECDTEERCGAMRCGAVRCGVVWCGVRLGWGGVMRCWGGSVAVLGWAFVGLMLG